MRSLFAWLSTAAALGMLAPSGCYSSNGSSPSPADGGCPTDATVLGNLVGAGPSTCNACLNTSCKPILDSCATDCACNETALTALSCLENLGGNASLAGASACIAPLGNASDPQLATLGACLLAKCPNQCGGEPPEGGPDARSACDATGTSLGALLDSGSGSCESCLQASCSTVVGQCAADCMCNAEAVGVLECLANLPDATSFVSVTVCLGPLQTATRGSPLAAVGVCMLSSCGATCAATTDAGIDATADAGSSLPDGSTVTAVDSGLDAGTDAACVACGDAGCIYIDSDPRNCGVCGHDCLGGGCSGSLCQQVELTSASAPPTALSLEGTNLYWTANQGGNGAVLKISVPVSTGIFTLASGTGRLYGAIGASSSSLFFVDQTGGALFTMPQVYTATPGVLVPSGVTAGVAVQQTNLDGGADAAAGNVYYGTATAVGWVSFPTSAGPQTSMSLTGTVQVAVDAANVYALAPTAVRACPLGTPCGAGTTIASGLTQGQGIYSDGTWVWITDQGASADAAAATGAIYKCPTSGCTGSPPTPFVSGRSNPYAIVADGTYVYWTENYQGGVIVRCPVAGCGVGGPVAVAHAYEYPTALVQDATRIYWADVNNISMVAK